MTSSSSSSVNAPKELSWFERIDNCNRYPSRLLAEKLERCENDPNLKGPDKVDLLFDEYLAKLCDFQSFYPFLRLIAPEVDGRGYGMKAKEVTKMYAELLGMQANTDQYRNLMNEKSALDSSSRIRQALETMKGSLVGHSEKTIGEVNALLDSLAAASNKTDRKSIFRDIFLKFPPLEQKWIVRLILRDHKIGVKITTILPRLHLDAQNQFNSNTSMIYISSWLATKAFNKVMSEGDTDRADSTSGHGGRIIPLNPFQPMLAARGDKTGPILNSVMEMVRDKPFVCDEKMDGERMLFHKKGRQVSFYTRRGNNYTDKYQVLLRRVGKICEVVGIDDVILDGEVLAWDKRVEGYVPFGQNRSVGNREIESAVRRTPAEDEVGADNGNRKEVDEGDHQELRYVLFDCVYIKTYNDENAEDEDNARASYPKVYSTTIEGNYGHRSKGATAEEILRMAHGNAVQERRMAVEEARKVGHLLKGGSLTQLPLAIRRAALVYIMQQAKDSLMRDGTLSSEDGDRVRIVDHCDFPFNENTGLMPPVAELSAEVNNYFSNICEDGGEGAVVKTWDSTYLCGEYNRNKGRWMKMKPDHDAGGGISDLDVAIIGAYHGKDDGRLSTKWGSFLVAVRQNVPAVGPDGKEDGSGVHYMGFGKVGNGISVLERDQIKRDMENRGVCREISFEQWRDEGAPPGFEQYVLFNGPNCSLPKKDWPHVFWPPFGDSEVHYTMTVQCAELYPSSSFPTGITCRFAHCTAIRTDKLMWQIIDYSQLENLRKKHIVDQTVRDNLASNKASGKAGKSQRRRSRQVQSDFLQNGHQASGLVAEAAGGALLFDKMTFHVDVTGSFSDGSVLRATSPAAMASVKDPPIPQDTRARAKASDLWCVMYTHKSIAIFGAVNEYLDRLQKIKDTHPHFGCGINENLLHPITKERGTLGWTSSTPAAMRTILHRELNKVGEKPVVLFYENPDVPWPALTRQTSARDVARQESLRQSPPLPSALNPSSSSTSSSASKAAGATIAAGTESGAKSKTEEEMTAQKLANLIKVHGGSLEATAKSESAVIVVGPRRPMSISLMNAIRNGDLDIISYEWILESIDRARADLQKGKAPRVLKSFVFKHLLAPSIDSVNNLGTIARNEFGEKMGKKPGEIVVMEGADAQRLCARAMGHGLRVVRRARGDQVSADSKAHAQAMKVDIEQLYGLGGRGCRDWREITQASLGLLPRLGEDSLARAQLVMKRQREGDNTEGDAMEVSAKCDNLGHTGGEEAEDRDALANLVHTVAPLWSQDVVVWSVNSPPPHDDAYHDMIVAAMQDLGCTIPPSEQIDDKNFRWRDCVGGPLGSVSHILVPPSLLPSVLSRLEERIESKFSRNGTKKRKTARPYIVNTGWAERCVEQEQIVSTEGFVVTSGGGTHGN